VFATGTARAERGGNGAGKGISTSRVDFLVTVPHFLDIRLSPSNGAPEEASALLEKVRNGGGQPLRDAVGEAGALRVDSVRVASNRGQVVLTMRSDFRRTDSPQLHDVSYQEPRLEPQYFLYAVASAAEGHPGVWRAGAVPAPDRAGVTQTKTAWLRAYSRNAGFVRAVARTQSADQTAPTAIYTVVVP